MRIKFFLLLTLISFGFASNLKVAVAANVSYAIKDLIKDFNKKYPDIKVEPIIGSSGKLSAQILHGAPYDIFISADMAYPSKLYKQGAALNKPEIYAKGMLALFTSKDYNLSRGLNTLLDENIKKIAIANAKTAPYGVITKEALEKAKIYERVKSKFIYGESIGQTLTYAIKAADIGIVAKSSLYSKELSHFKKGKNWVDANPTLYTPTKQGIVITKRAANSKEAKLFYDYILSKRAKEIFKKYGYQE